METFIAVILSITCLLLGLLTVIFLRKWFQAMSIVSKLKGEKRALENEIHRKENIIIKEKANRRDVSVSYFTETMKDDGFFSDRYIITYKMQLVVDELPIGNSTTVKIDSFRKVDKQQVNQTLQDFAKPLVELGVKVAIAQLGV